MRSNECSQPSETRARATRGEGTPDRTFVGRSSRRWKRGGWTKAARRGGAVLLLAAAGFTLAPAVGWGQWLFNGTHIYNSNTGNIWIGNGASGTPGQKLTLGFGNILLTNANGQIDGNIFFGGNTVTGQVGMRLFGGLVNGAIPAGFIDVMTTDPNDGLRIRVDGLSGGTERMRITASGNVGIATTTPAFRLDLGGLPRLAFDPTSVTPDAANILFGDGSGWKLNIAKRSDSGVTKFVTFQDNGLVGIGTTTPVEHLTLGPGRFLRIQADPGNDTTVQLAGFSLASREAGGFTRLWRIYTAAVGGGSGVPINSFSIWDYPGQPGAGSCCNPRFTILPSANGAAAPPQVTIDGQGNLTVGGNIAAKYQDLAEWVPASQHLAPGTVVVIDPVRPNQVLAAARAYDTAVAGVVSLQPGVLLGQAGAGKAAIATTGRVKVHADATSAPIHMGDLLVTSDREGMVMKSEPIEVAGARIHRPGTVVGKALEPLEQGQGEILMLLSLQ